MHLLCKDKIANFKYFYVTYMVQSILAVSVHLGGASSRCSDGQTGRARHLMKHGGDIDLETQQPGCDYLRQRRRPVKLCSTSSDSNNWIAHPRRRPL
jgi:hypothetical protein